MNSPAAVSRFGKGTDEFGCIYEKVRLIGQDVDKLVALCRAPVLLPGRAAAHKAGQDAGG